MSEAKDILLRETSSFDSNNKLVKVKIAKFTVNGQPHTIIVSKEDFDAGRTRQLIDREIAKIDAINTSHK